MVLDVLRRGERLLKNAGRFREHHPTTSGQEWKHDFMRATIISSVLIAAKANQCAFIYPDEVLAELDGTTAFAVPDYHYTTAKNEVSIRKGAHYDRMASSPFAMRMVRNAFSSSKPTAGRNPIEVTTWSEKATSTTFCRITPFFPKERPVKLISEALA